MKSLSPVLFVSLCGAVLCWQSLAQAQTGVSDDRVSLPEGPGSLEGVGENTMINTNMGMMSQSVDIKVPAGFDAVTPDLGLSYSSGGGAGVLGMGWSMEMPSIERMTYRKLPQYNSEDDFAAGGGEQLVRIPGTNTFRARYEKGFVRYTWVDEGSGDQGYWIGEMPDGSRCYFGATAEGTLVPEARVGAEAGTFKYMMVEKVDVYGHKLVYDYHKAGHYSLPVHIGYVFTDGSHPTYEVELHYEDRREGLAWDKLSDAAPGFNMLLDQRLARIDVLSRGVTIRSYELGYVPFAQSGGISLLARIEQKGMQGDTYPVIFDFAYSQALGGGEGEGNQPFMVDMGTLEASFVTRQAQLIDINGDALPDVVDSSQTGGHRFFLNMAQEDGTTRFDPSPVVSAVGTQSSHNLSQPTVQVLDVDGDGFTDLVNALTGQVLVNKGGGDWMMADDNSGVQDLASALAEEVDEGELQAIRFIDFNNDKRIDLMKSTLFETTMTQNLGTQGFAPMEDGQVTTLGAGFVENNLELADMNGDGLLDVVQLQVGSLRYWLNLGWGKWQDPVDIDGVELSVVQQDNASLEDINGDALADLVVVVGRSVLYALNDNAAGFGALVPVENVQGELPLREENTLVLFADMNGNGSSDVVWIQADGKVDYLELFPLRPNLMTKITNGLGAVTEITYETAAQQMARDGGWQQWQYKIPYPMNIVRRLEQYDLLTELRQVTEYSYHDGFYDGQEKQFRGFARVETRLVGDDTIEEGELREVFDVGAQDAYRHGLRLSSQDFSQGRELRQSSAEYEDCPLEGVPEGTELPVRFLCQTRSATTHKEGLAQDQWVTTESESQYDGYGNVTLSLEHGITSEGGDACAPCGDRDADDFGLACGAQCLGDELYTQTDYVSPEDTGGRWLLRAPYRMQAYGRPGSSLRTESLTYYDGDDFEGLPLGTMAVGNVTRTTQKVEADSDRVITTSRSAYDEHGNVLEQLDPLGEPDGTTHRRRYTYDEEGLRGTLVEIFLEDPQGEPYILAREASYEEFFDQTESVSAWRRVVDGASQSNERTWTMVYDQFGRLSQRYLPGNQGQNADESFTYELSSPVSRVITHQRSLSDGEQDIELVECFDGRGRSFQSRLLLRPGSYQVTGWTRYNLRSLEVEGFQPYLSTSGQCDLEPPEGTRATRQRFDALHRLVETTYPDEGQREGQPSVQRLAYAPMSTAIYDEADSDPASDFFDTPTRVRVNGLGLTVATERLLTAQGQGATISSHYDSLGRMTGYTDPGSHRKEQRHDLLGRLLEISDPNRGELERYTYDDASNLIAHEDARGVITRKSYDGSNRLVQAWDDADRDGSLIEWTYDHMEGCGQSCINGEGALVATSYPDGQQGRVRNTMGFDTRGRLISTQRQWRGVSYEIRLTLDNVDRIVRLDFPGGLSQERTLDSASRLTSVPGILGQLAYNQHALLERTVHSDGSVDQRAYDDRLRTVQWETTLGAEPVQSLSYTLSRDGLALARLDGAKGAGRPDFDATYQYDAWDRVTQAALSGGDTLTFGFDQLDNLREVSSSQGQGSAAHQGSLSYEGFAPNALSSVGQETLDYDAAGQASLRQGRAMSWDFMGRLTQVQGSATFLYGENQSRVHKQEGDSSTHYLGKDFEVRDGIATMYVRVGRHRVARQESAALATQVLGDPIADGQVNAADAFAVGAEGDSSGALLWSSVRRLLLETGPEDGLTHLHHDRLGSLTLATGVMDGQAVVLGQRDFYPLGAERPGASGYVDEYGFTGQEIDRSTGLLHFDWRYYDPALGRWLSVDPAFLEASPNTIHRLGESTTAYAYVGGNFINFVDTTGLAGEEGEGDDLDLFAEGRSGDQSLGAQPGKVDRDAAPSASKAAEQPRNQVEETMSPSEIDLVDALQKYADGERSVRSTIKDLRRRKNIKEQQRDLKEYTAKFEALATEYLGPLRALDERLTNAENLGGISEKKLKRIHRLRDRAERIQRDRASRFTKRGRSIRANYQLKLERRRELRRLRRKMRSPEGSGNVWAGARGGGARGARAGR